VEQERAELDPGIASAEQVPDPKERRIQPSPLLAITRLQIPEERWAIPDRSPEQRIQCDCFTSCPPPLQKAGRAIHPARGYDGALMPIHLAGKG
jgi:hypothetical protein